MNHGRDVSGTRWQSGHWLIETPFEAQYVAAVGKSQGWSFEPKTRTSVGDGVNLASSDSDANGSKKGSLLNLRGNCEADWGCKGLLVRGGET